MGSIGDFTQCPPFTVEPTPEYPLQLRKVTYAQLYEIVRDVVSALLYYGLRPGDRVASYSSNCIARVFLGANGFILTHRIVSLGKCSCMLGDYRYRGYLGQRSSWFWAGRCNRTVCYIIKWFLSHSCNIRIDWIKYNQDSSSQLMLWCTLILLLWLLRPSKLCLAITTRCINTYPSSPHCF